MSDFMRQSNHNIHLRGIQGNELYAYIIATRPCQKHQGKPLSLQ